MTQEVKFIDHEYQKQLLKKCYEVYPYAYSFVDLYDNAIKNLVYLIDSGCIETDIQKLRYKIISDCEDSRNTNRLLITPKGIEMITGYTVSMLKPYKR